MEEFRKRMEALDNQAVALVVRLDLITLLNIHIMILLLMINLLDDLSTLSIGDMLCFGL